MVEGERQKGEGVAGGQAVQASLFLWQHRRHKCHEVLLGNRDVEEKIHDDVVREDRRVVGITRDAPEIVAVLIVEPPVSSHALSYL